MHDTEAVSPIFSLADRFEYDGHRNVFNCLGVSHNGDYHIAVFFRSMRSSLLLVDHTHPIQLTPTCVSYPIRNSRGTLYGCLLVVQQGTFVLVDGSLTVKSNKPLGKFEHLPVVDDRSLSIFVDGNGNMVATLNTYEFNELTVLDEV